MEIRRVDFSGVRSGEDASKAVLDQLHEAFSTIGFVTIINHGVEEKVSRSDVIRSIPLYNLSQWLYLSATGCVLTQAIRPELQNLEYIFLRKISNHKGNRTKVNTSLILRSSYHSRAISRVLLLRFFRFKHLNIHHF